MSQFNGILVNLYNYFNSDRITCSKNYIYTSEVKYRYENRAYFSDSVSITAFQTENILRNVHILALSLGKY